LRQGHGPGGRTPRGAPGRYPALLPAAVVIWQLRDQTGWPGPGNPRDPADPAGNIGLLTSGIQREWRIRRPPITAWL